MNRLVECVPNFSEGRRPEVVDAIVNAITSVSGVYLLAHEMDADHNRAVVTKVEARQSCVRYPLILRRSPAYLADELFPS